MISMDVHRLSQVVEVVPASPPPPPRSPSPEIRVTDTPEPSSPIQHSAQSPPCSPRSSFSSSPPTSPPTGFTMGHSINGMGPLLFQPFLPFAAYPMLSHPLLPSPVTSPHNISNNNNPFPARRALPFSIDNILKPNFGPKLEFPQSLFGQSIGAPPPAKMARTRSPSNTRIPTTTSPPLSSASSTSSSSSSTSPITSSKSSNNNNNTSGQPVDLSNKSGDSNKGDEDLPPGMVRGPNGQLWPAWVFCTRYSDRPSSGKISYSIVFIFVLMVLKEKLNPTKISQTKRYFQSHDNF